MRTKFAPEFPCVHRKISAVLAVWFQCGIPNGPCQLYPVVTIQVGPYMNSNIP